MSTTQAALSDERTVSCTIRADSTLQTPRFAPAKLLDGNSHDSESRWASARSAPPHWVTVTTDQPVAINRVVVHGHPGEDLSLADACVQILRDGKWIQVAAIQDNRQARVEFGFERVVARAVRLWISRPCRRDTTARLFEIELYDGPSRLRLRPKKGRPQQKRFQASRPVEPRIPDGELLSAVRPFPLEALSAPSDDASARRLMQQCYESVLVWDDVLLERFEPVPNRPQAGYYGRGGHKEDDIRPITYAAMVNGFLSVVAPPQDPPTEARRRRMRLDAIRALRYLTHAHVSGKGTCANGERWGNQWQSAMWARSAGMAGWMIWPHLDEPLKLAVARLVEHEADRFLHTEPKSSEFRDTGAEENAWNALVLSLACNMMPSHARAKRWDQAAKRYLYNSLSVAADRADRRIGDDGLPICRWVTTVNAHPDFTVENHGLVHIGYLKTTVGLMLECAAHYVATGTAVPKACVHHVPEAFDVLTSCMAWDAAPVYFGGNDWKTVHTQSTDVVIYAMLNAVAGDGLAAHLEAVALRVLRQIQTHERGYYNVRRDIEFGGLCATRLIACYMAHARRGAGAEPISEETLNQRVTGVRFLEHAKAVIHRTPTKFASFTWGPKRLALALPKNGSWVVWPHFASYLGLVNGQEPSHRHAKLVSIRHGVNREGFWVIGALERLGGALTQDFAYVSPAGDVTIYAERLRMRPGSRLAARETGVIGHEYPLGNNERTIFTKEGSLRVRGVGSEERTIALESDWLNLGDQVGYVVRRLPSRQARNVIRYHDLPRGRGRVPKLQEWFSLIGDPVPGEWADREDWAVVVTLLNQTAGQTRDKAREITFEAPDNIAVVRIGNDSYRIDFARGEMRGK